MCVPSMGIWYRRNQIIPEDKSLRQLADELVKPVSKSQAGCREAYSKGSETAKSGTDEQSLSRTSGNGIRRPEREGKQAQLVPLSGIFAKPVANNPFLVDAAEDKAGALGQVCVQQEGICPYPAMRDRLWGDLRIHEMESEKSAEAIVVNRT
ncbi:hypothetical protein [Arthrospiribacter ruber]|uniref:Uncharacterized protein n=1 Tax=Arthrospiribacter ruber TaxID=2487934 RepID=A0A951IVD0_9BACT|nr:hypothetical protein [Arthrospiribacter ruber]MBW3466223.1 hypothetical protein [Arthrospiribacter ruber]